MNERRPYTLTLTYEERRAFEWIGSRYNHGTDMLRLVWAGKLIDPDPETVEDIDDARPLTLAFTEAEAWAIRNLVDDDGRDPYPWDCFAPELAGKMQAFIDAII